MDDIIFDLQPMLNWLVRGGWIWVGLATSAVAYWAFKGR